MSNAPYRLASVVLAFAAVAAGFVVLPATITHRDLSGTESAVSFTDALRYQFNLQRDALTHQVRLEVRENADWRAGNSPLEQLSRAEPNSTLMLKVLCTDGQRSVELSRARATGRDAPESVGDIRTAVLNNTLRSAWRLTERGEKRSFFSARQLDGFGWSYRDAHAAEDAAPTLLKAFPDMGLDCTTTQPKAGSLQEALALPGSERMTVEAFLAQAAQFDAGLTFFSDYFMKLGAARLTKDAGAGVTTIEVTYGYGNDAAAAGGAFLKARADFARRFAHVTHQHQRTGVNAELTRNGYALDNEGLLTLELERGQAGDWVVNYSVALPHATAALLSAPSADEVSGGPAVSDAPAPSVAPAPVAQPASAAGTPQVN